MITRPMVEDDASTGFTCGEHALDDYFRRHAFKNHARGIGRTFVLPAARADAKPRIRGFYTLSMASIEAAQVASALTDLPRYPLPAALIGRFAVHEGLQGQGIGQALLRDALERVLEVSEQFGCLVVIVDAKQAQAAKFYEKLGFFTTNTSAWPRRMFLPVATLRG